MSVKKYFQKELKNAKREVSQLQGAAKLQYVWDYYKLWIIGIVCLIAFVIYFVIARAMTPNDNWFYITIANTQADAGNKSQIWRDFVDYSGYDTKEKNVYFNTNCYFDPFSEKVNQYYTYFVAYVDAGTLDLIAMEKDDLQKLGEKGRLLDLTAPEAARIMEMYGDRLIYAVPLIIIRLDTVNQPLYAFIFCFFGCGVLAMTVTKLLMKPIERIRELNKAQEA
jgi:hypothetical protein